MEAGPVDQPNIGQEAPRVRAPDIEVFLLSAYYQKSQNRRNPLKAKFRVVRVCKIPHPYKDRIDRLVAQVEGPNAVLGNPATYRGQVLRLLCNLLFPLEASYISDQLLSYRVLRSISSANLPLLVRMGLSTEVTLARNQRGQLCQYIKVFFLSELIYQRRIRCKEDKIAELASHAKLVEIAESKKEPREILQQQHGLVKLFFPSITQYISVIYYYHVQQKDIQDTHQFLTSLNHGVQFRWNILTESLTMVSNPNSVPPNMMPIVMETNLNSIENERSRSQLSDFQIPLLGKTTKHYATEKLFAESKHEMITKFGIVKNDAQLYQQRKWHFYSSSFHKNISWSGKRPFEHSTLSIGDILNQINANTPDIRIYGQFARGSIGRFNFVYDGLQAIQISSVSISQYDKQNLDLGLCFQQLLKHMVSAADCLDQYITHFFSFRDRPNSLTANLHSNTHKFQELCEFQLLLQELIRMVTAPNLELADLLKLVGKLLTAKTENLNNEIQQLERTQITAATVTGAKSELVLVNNLSDKYLELVKMDKKLPYSNTLSKADNCLPRITQAFNRQIDTIYLVHILTKHLLEASAHGTALGFSSAELWRDLKGRPLGIWNHKTKNLIRYKNKFVWVNNRYIFCTDLDSNLPEPKFIKITPEFGPEMHEHRVLGVFGHWMVFESANAGSTKIKASDLRTLTDHKHLQNFAQSTVTISTGLKIPPNSVCLANGLLGFIEDEVASQGKICILKLNPETGLSEHQTTASVSQVCKLPHNLFQVNIPVMQIFGQGFASRYVIIAFKQHSDRNHTSFNRSLQLLRYNPGSDNLEFLDGFQDTYYKTGSRTIFFEKNRVPFVLEFNFHSSVLHGVSKDNKLVKVSDNPLKKIPLLDWPNKQWTIRYHLKDAVGLPQKTDSSGLLHIAIRGSQLDGQSSLRIYSVKLQM